MTHWYSWQDINLINCKTKLIVVLCFSILLTACESMAPATGDAAKVKDENLGVFMIFSEREQAGTELFKSRMFINKYYIYINDDRFPDDFLLFDRQKQTIYTVTHVNKTIFVIKPKEITREPPIEIKYEAVSQPSSAIPKVSGRTATHYRYDANGVHCYDAVTLEKTFLPDVVQALREYRLVLAGEHASTVHAMPLETHDACDLALNIYYAAKHLDTGLPLREWDQRGYLRFMLDYRLDFKFDENKFNLPADYKEYSVGQ
ncbi:MAG: hypothetical protein L0Z73_18380 [Gammaproteobacteria bacterium]|nr:hypothetical protein [Gammaproteobacteria bacterium]